MNEDVAVLMADTDEFSKKAELLRAIEREIAEGLVPETILESLQDVEKFDRAIAGNAAASGSMRAAYCAVALECTVKLLVAGGGIPGLMYRNVFDRIWRGRVAELERLGESELVTSEVKEWRDELQASFWDRNVCKKLCGMNTRNEAVSRVRFYLEEEGKSMGLPFLGCEGEFMKEREGVGLEGLRSLNSVKESSFKASEEVLDEEIREDDRVLVNDSEMVVAKPSPKTLLGAEIIMSLSNDKTNRKDTLESKSEKEVDDANKPVRKSTDQLVKTSDVNVENPSFENRGNVPRPSLMERNRTACTYEHVVASFSFCDWFVLEVFEYKLPCSQWDEPIHDLPKATNNHERRIYGPSPKIKAVDPPLEKNGAQKTSGRRKSRRWSLHEEDTLRIAVKRYGKQWKLILNTLGNEFDERTEVDLKDKWRNLMKYSHR